MSRKGFIFTLDIMFAIVVAMTIVFGIFYFSQKTQTKGNLYAEKVANDILVVLGKNKTLETLNQQKINSSLFSILPSNFATKLNITVYECENQNCDEFEIEDDNNILITIPNGAVEDDAVIARRTLLNFSNNKIKYFANAELRLWLR